MQHKLEYEGIFAACKSAPHCVCLKDSKSPILQCGEFKGFSPVTRKPFNADNPKQTGAFAATTTQNSDATKYKGLCINCVTRETCTFPQPEGGVWRCEEYE